MLRIVRSQDIARLEIKRTSITRLKQDDDALRAFRKENRLEIKRTSITRLKLLTDDGHGLFELA